MGSQFTQVTFPLEAFNHGAQWVAICDLLERQARADRELADRIKEADEFTKRTIGRLNEHAVDVWVELAEMSCYQDAAHSMAAVGMICPLYRILVSGIFPLYRKRLAKGKPRQEHSKAYGRGRHGGVHADRS